MKWRKVSLTTTAQAVDFVSNMLDEIGIEGIEIEDNIPLSEEDTTAMFIDILPEPKAEDDGTAVVSFYLEMQQDEKEIIDRVEEGLKELSAFVDLGKREIVVSETEDKDWMNNWKQYFKPFTVGDNIIIKPTWEEITEKEKKDIVIEIDPGSAFGTGSHETTKLCILALEKYITRDMKLLDIGCGSGILSIAGIKLGAATAAAIDIDPNAANVAKENRQVNHILEEKLHILSGDVLADTSLDNEIGLKQYDIVVANILADVIIPLSHVVGKYMKENGVFISSGIIDMKKEEVKAALIENGFLIEEINHLGDWYSFVGRLQR